MAPEFGWFIQRYVILTLRRIKGLHNDETHKIMVIRYATQHRCSVETLFWAMSHSDSFDADLTLIYSIGEFQTIFEITSGLRRNISFFLSYLQIKVILWFTNIFVYKKEDRLRSRQKLITKVLQYKQ
jgi:hypothetical protein